jgi:hypothetical protein
MLVTYVMLGWFKVYVVCSKGGDPEGLPRRAGHAGIAVAVSGGRCEAPKGELARR